MFSAAKLRYAARNLCPFPAQKFISSTAGLLYGLIAFIIPPLSNTPIHPAYQPVVMMPIVPTHKYRAFLPGYFLSTSDCEFTSGSQPT